MSRHTEARERAARALSLVFGAPASYQAARVLAGIACLETSYGYGWKGAGKGSNNMGAIQCGSSWKGARFSYTDTHPNADGTSTAYRVDFRAYPTPEDGWVDLVKVVFINRGRSKVLEAALSGDLQKVSAQLHATGYYEGFGRTVQERIAHHHAALRSCVLAADNTPNEAGRPLVDPGAMPTLRRGSSGPAVATLQRGLQLVADGEFGPITETEVREYQGRCGLVVDGVVGPRTWTALASDGYTP